ncbi:MAG: aminotransferase class I/II-fold pyridoxal phosphate-dependent enzyme, partial [Chloroflexi bacterium]|nr:aminotransferase class I/II-fold pyridoxal phosphate-dependent enzyme [Chloroflexota bacterium]
ANVARLREERARLYRGLQAIPYLRPVESSQANFILCPVVGRSALELKQQLAQRGILVRHYDTPLLRDSIRISLGKPEHSQAILAALAELA